MGVVGAAVVTKKTLFYVSSKTIIPAGLLAITLGMTGGQWDSWLHVKHGHELLAIPHIIIIGGLMLFTFSGFLAFLILLFGRNALSEIERRGMWLALFGGGMIPFALAFDEAWHRFIGLDQTAWSAPHMILFMGVAAVLIGLALFTHVKSKILPMLFFATVFLLGLFSLGDFDQPHMQEVVRSMRPGFTYPIAVTFIFTLAFMLTAVVTKRVGIATTAALLAWALHITTASVIGEIGGFMHTVTPFPIMLPALIFDICLFRSAKTTQDVRLEFRDYLLITLITASACYFLTVSWSALFTEKEVPQQLSGNLSDWVRWYVWFIPGIALAITWLGDLFSQWAKLK